MAACGPPTSMTTVSSVTESLFQRGSQYQQFRPTYPPSLFQWLANQCPCRDRAMDLGCGSGQASRGLEPWFRQVIGADISHPQLLAAPPSSSHYLVSVAHRLSTAERSDLVLVFDAGRIAEQGSHDDLVARGGIYAGLYRSWLGGTRPPGTSREGTAR